MAWTLKMRTTSAAVAVLVALTEYALVAAPIGLIVWLADAAPAWRIVSVASDLGAAWALAIVLVTHVRPLRIRTHAREAQDLRFPLPPGESLP